MLALLLTGVGAEDTSGQYTSVTEVLSSGPLVPLSGGGPPELVGDRVALTAGHDPDGPVPAQVVPRPRPQDDEPVPDLTSFPSAGGFREHVEWCCEVYGALQHDPYRAGADRAR